MVSVWGTIFLSAHTRPIYLTYFAACIIVTITPRVTTTGSGYMSDFLAKMLPKWVILRVLYQYFSLECTLSQEANREHFEE